MDADILNRIQELKDSHAKIMFGRGHAGQCKIKVKHGPMNMLTTRYVVDPQTYEAAKQLVQGTSSESGTNTQNEHKHTA